MQNLAPEHRLPDVDPLQMKAGRLVEEAQHRRETALGDFAQLAGRV
jgi:hypothetical protein